MVRQTPSEVDNAGMGEEERGVDVNADAKSLDLAAEVEVAADPLTITFVTTPEPSA